MLASEMPRAFHTELPHHLYRPDVVLMLKTLMTGRVATAPLCGHYTADTPTREIDTIGLGVRAA
jgi:hypothetical protein